ncbi:hypothetical protein LJ928_004528 [Salmonella enterica]|nr:hypothetical protein [Salmonella enterica]EDQ6232219.1 hypothetical protein [Salmonella enterica subsp. enterica serovar Tucson]EDR6860392.1 hypothetical protein [Salmonella enterica subsp. enterica]EBA7470669.1 hypothetical protein [Salmonella enterica]EDU3654211.1 hypothetical protein [Salmonella enterica subsp. enterica serovar Tucson]
MPVIVLREGVELNSFAVKLRSTVCLFNALSDNYNATSAVWNKVDRLEKQLTDNKVIKPVEKKTDALRLSIASRLRNKLRNREAFLSGFSVFFESSVLNSG